jgi:hypothetical protein
MPQTSSPKLILREMQSGIAAMLRIVSLILCVAFSSLCQTQTVAPPKRHLLVLGEEKGYRHEAVSHAIATIERLGRETGLWTTTIRTDTEVLTKKKLE